MPYIEYILSTHHASLHQAPTPLFTLKGWKECIKGPPIRSLYQQV